MNEALDNRSTADDELARAYRELATERTPATLNEQVLWRAAHAAGHGYPRWAGWLRPLAWAATVGLTLAIVIELGDSAVPGGDPVDVTNDSVEEALPRREAGSEHRETADRDTLAEPGNDPAAEPSRQAGESTPASAAFKVDDTSLLEQAADLAAVRSGSESQQRAAAADALAADWPACDETARERPSAWYDCIEQLRAEGRTELAGRELDALTAAFPDFKPPDAQAR